MALLTQQNTYDISNRTLMCQLCFGKNEEVFHLRTPKGTPLSQHDSFSTKRHASVVSQSNHSQVSLSSLFFCHENHLHVLHHQVV